MKDPLEEATVEVDPAAARPRILRRCSSPRWSALAVFVPGSRIPLLLIVGIVLMVMLHEVGHYIMAKRAGMKVTEFFLGFGPRLWSFQPRRDRVRREGAPARRLRAHHRHEQPRGGRSRPTSPARTARAATGDRLKVVLAGVTVNLLIAFLLFFVVIVGRGVADGPEHHRRAPSSRGSAAAQAGLQHGDHIVAVDGQPVTGWDELKRAIEANGGTQIVLTVERNGREVRSRPPRRIEGGQGFLGVSPDHRVPRRRRARGGARVVQVHGRRHHRHRRRPRQAASRRRASPTYSKNFTSDAPEGGIAGGPQPAAVARRHRRPGQRPRRQRPLDACCSLLGGISLILAVFNLLPVLPILDGGHAAIVVYEWTRRRSSTVGWRSTTARFMPIGVTFFAVLMTIALSAMFLDVRQAIGQ